MQDFIKQNNLTIPSNDKPSSKKSWAGDRFWTVVFWLTMSLGISTTVSFSNITNLKIASGFIMLLALVIVGLIQQRFNGIRSIKDDIAIKDNGEQFDISVLSKSYLFGFVMFITLPTNLIFIISALAGPTVDSIIFFGIFKISFILLAPISLFFIFKNCPISILFTRHLWRLEARPHTGGNYTATKLHNRGSNSSDYIYNPGYSGLTANIHNRHRR